MTSYSIHLLANNLVGDSNFSIEIIPGVLFRKANEKELPQFKSLVANICKGNLGWDSPYETHWIPDEKGGHTSTEILNPNDWKYWVVTDALGGSPCHRLFQVASLVNPKLALSVQLMSFTEKNTGTEHFGFSYPNHHVGKEYWAIGNNHLIGYPVEKIPFNEFGLLYEQFSALSEDFEFVKRALKTLNEIESLGDYSPLRIVGQFSIIESLITHSPRLNESLDSITHQIRGKVTLVGRKFNQGQGLEKPERYKDITDKTLWSKLYAYRSQIAHGSAPSFKKDLSCLVDEPTVRNFLQYVCIELIKVGLSEPRLLADLREC